MESAIGNYLQRLRALRCLPTSQLACKAGIARATLYRWQSGKSRPRLQELEAVLNAMSASPTERTSALNLLTSSSTIKRRRQDVIKIQANYAELAGPQPHCGDLLRALRLRNGKTQAHVARIVGTTQATVARWERAEGWPEPPRLRLFAEALEVRDAEFAALSLGPFMTEPGGLTPCLEVLREEWKACWTWPHTPVKVAFAELMLLKLAAQTWLLACHSSRALKLLADIFTVYAEHLFFQRRFPECEQIALRAQDIYAAFGNEADPFWARAVLRGSSALAQKGSQRATERAMRQLRERFPAGSTMLYKSWMLSELGKMAGQRGQTAEALRLGTQAVSLAETWGDLSELSFRQEDMARILLRAGQPQEALLAAPLPASHAYSFFVHAEAHLALGQPEEARQLLLSASEWIEAQEPFAAHETPYYRAELQALLSRF